MAIESLSITNFKGISAPTNFAIKPITLFIGPNSSGKSSCLHALAALAQTIKLAGSRLPIVLDDEFAQVHLGRFIEVIHSKSYSDSIELGFTFTAPSKFGYSKESLIDKGASISANFSFKSTKRTQDIFIERAEFITPKIALVYRKTAKDDTYSVRLDGKATTFTALHIGGLRFSVMPTKASKTAADNFFEILTVNEAINDFLAKELRNTLYLGPFRQSPMRRYPTRGAAPLEVGAQGEAAVTLLANEYVQTKTRAHIKQIGQWMQTLGLAKSVDVARMGNSDLFNVAVTLPDDAKLPIADLGYGVSQVLPVLSQCSFSPKGATLLFEQPELHLHPAAAMGLATVFAEIVKKKNLRIVAETHSRELFVQLLDELRAKRIGLEDIAAYKVVRQDGQSHFEPIEIIEEDGYIEVINPWDGALMRRT